MTFRHIYVYLYSGSNVNQIYFKQVYLTFRHIYVYLYSGSNVNQIYFKQVYLTFRHIYVYLYSGSNVNQIYFKQVYLTFRHIYVYLYSGSKWIREYCQQWVISRFSKNLELVGNLHGVMASVHDCDIVARVFEFLSRYRIHFRTNTVVERYKPPILPKLWVFVDCPLNGKVQHKAFLGGSGRRAGAHTHPGFSKNTYGPVCILLVRGASGARQ